jgi:hypothetical protein
MDRRPLAGWACACSLSAGRQQLHREQVPGGRDIHDQRVTGVEALRVRVGAG